MLLRLAPRPAGGYALPMSMTKDEVGAVLEAITGQLYLAILLARLVSLEVAGRS